MRKKLWMVSMCVFVFVAALLLGSVTASYAADAKAGKAVFDSTKCSMCHGKDAKGGKMGPSLAGKADAKAKGAIQNGIKPKMPAYGKKLKAADVDNILEFLKSVK